MVGHDGNRGQVIRKYEQWLLGNPELCSAYQNCKAKRSGAGAKPLLCHGDVLARLADERGAGRAILPSSKVFRLKVGNPPPKSLRRQFDQKQTSGFADL